ncbi:3-oxoacyl-ACP synthase [Streptomyces glomeratus]|uniref:Beta-ketoacyl-[acyl-carrier-protein] synthase III N-terminal domain-containing protein n=1 Tax=Streptomyces glomeratus TaxID=284452 RepID=A0ABP6LZY5_9ACTN|nr:3-oxoacyl-ACP synthase [Streptomyces glomeratus]MCF1510088.1 3-oxoacyl-ACP synthase [Streptomyces glomeratus]
MSSSPAFLVAPRYVLGETEEPHTALENLAARAAHYGIPMAPRTWGWGSYFRTRRSTVELAVASGIATLEASGAARASVDGLIVCTSSFPSSVDDHAGFLGAVLNGLGLPGVSFASGMTLNRCNNLLAALHVATSLVRAGSRRRVLVVTADRIADEAARLEKFALFSDGAASCLVSADEGPDGFAVLASASAQDADVLGLRDQIDSRLAVAVNEELERATGIPPEKITALLPANLVRPLVTMKERQAGFTTAQMRTGNIERVGHCFAADPLINLVDLVASGEGEPDGLYLLASSVPGARHGVLLRKLA